MSYVVPTSWTLLQGFLRRRINIKDIQFMSSRGSLISAWGLKEIQNRNESQRCNDFHTAGAVFIHISWKLHGRGDHHFYWNGAAESQGFTVRVKHCVTFQEHSLWGFFCLYLTIGVKRKKNKGIFPMCSLDWQPWRPLDCFQLNFIWAHPIFRYYTAMQLSEFLQYPNGRKFFIYDRLNYLREW